MHFFEDVEQRQMEKNRKKFQFTIYLLDKIEEMGYNKEVAAEK